MAELDAPRTSDGIRISPVETVEQAFAAAGVLAEVWGGDYSGMPAGLLRALAHSGNYAVGLYDGERIIGASVAFFAAPAERSMHSHVTGVLAEYRGAGLGRLLKHHQRAWAFTRDVGHITWTFDPLIARNAHFNLVVLGARVTEYLPNQYGAMDDVINRGDESDRLMVSWALAAPATPPDPETVVATVPVPADIETLRRESPAKALAWRRRVRDEFAEHAASGLIVAGFDDDSGYLFVRPSTP